MKDQDKTKEQLIDDLAKLCQRIDELEESEIQRNRAEEALKQALNQWQTTFNTMNDCISLMDLEGKILKCNKAMMEFVGKSSEEIIDSFCWELIHGESEPIEGCPIVRMKQTYQRENKILQLDDRWIEVIVDPQFDDDKKIIGAVHIISDITERKQTEEALQKSEERYRTLLESITDSVYVLDQKWRHILVNNAATDFVRIPKGKLMGGKLTDLFPGVEKTPFFKTFRQVMETRKADIVVDEYTFEDGRKGWYEVRVYPVPEGILCISRDITKRKRAEEQLKESLKEKDVLLQEIHHRVKNNMQVIVSLLRLQSEKIKSKKMREVLEASQSRIRSMALVHEKLYESRDFAKVNLAHYIKSLAIHLFSAYKVNTNIVRLKTEVKDVFLDIHRAVPSALIINELISNSLKYAFPEGRKGEICVKVHEDKKGKFTLIVSDNGIGIPKELDIHKAETLGLKLVTLLTEQLEGSIELDKKVGTSFKITF